MRETRGLIKTGSKPDPSTRLHDVLLPEGQDKGSYDFNSSVKFLKRGVHARIVGGGQERQTGVIIEMKTDSIELQRRFLMTLLSLMKSFISSHCDHVLCRVSNLQVCEH